MIRTSVITRAALAIAIAAIATSGRATPPDATAASRGKKVFDRYCISCHGVAGDGRGPTADFVDPRPRVLTSGVFKFRSTPSGELPTDGDILKTVTNGLHLTFMPRWAPLTSHERHDVVQYVKALSPRFATEPQGQPIAIPRPPPFTPQLATKGKEVWGRAQCAACHGATGRADVPSATSLRDDWGFGAGSLPAGSEAVRRVPQGDQAQRDDCIATGQRRLRAVVRGHAHPGRRLGARRVRPEPAQGVTRA